MHYAGYSCQLGTVVVKWGEVWDFKWETKENKFISNTISFKHECSYLLIQYMGINLKNNLYKRHLF